MKAIQVRETGGPEKLQLVETRHAPSRPQGRRWCASPRAASISSTFISALGLYKAEMPIALGQEGAGTVERWARR